MNLYLLLLFQCRSGTCVAEYRWRAPLLEGLRPISSANSMRRRSCVFIRAARLYPKIFSLSSRRRRFEYCWRRRCIPYLNCQRFN